MTRGEEAARAERRVRVVEPCYVRAAPSVAGAVLGVAKRGAALPCGEESTAGGWLAVVYGGMNGWVSERFGRLEP